MGHPIPVHQNHRPALCICGKGGTGTLQLLCVNQFKAQPQAIPRQQALDQGVAAFGKICPIGGTRVKRLTQQPFELCSLNLLD